MSENNQLLLEGQKYRSSEQDMLMKKDEQSKNAKSTCPQYQYDNKLSATPNLIHDLNTNYVMFNNLDCQSENGIIRLEGELEDEDIALIKQSLSSHFLFREKYDSIMYGFLFILVIKYWRN